jgi:hypothetical protein
LISAARTNPPEITDARNVVFSRHHPLKAVSEEGLSIYTALGKGFLENRPGDELCGARCDGRFDEHQTGGGNRLANSSHRCLKGCHLRFPGPHVTEIMFGVVTLDIYHHTVSKREAFAVVGCGKGFFLNHTALDDFTYFRILSLDR